MLSSASYARNPVCSLLTSFKLQAATHLTRLGRADAPATLCMSCSDKIAMWCSVGVQGALLVDLGLEPIRLGSIVIGDVHGRENVYGDLELIRQDCRRAFGARLQGVALPAAYRVRTPEIQWTPRRFGGGKCRPTEERISSNEGEASIFRTWYSSVAISLTIRSALLDSGVPQARGFGEWRSTRHKSKESPSGTPPVRGIFQWQVEFFGLLTHCPCLLYVARSRARHPSSYCTTRSQQLKLVHLRTSSPSFAKRAVLENENGRSSCRPQMYYDAKHGSRASVYHSAKAALRESDRAPFAGWPVKKHTQWELFALSQNN